MEATNVPETTNAAGEDENGARIIKTKEDYDLALQPDTHKDKLVVIDFYADWCGPCKMIGPKIKEMMKEFPEFTVYKISADDFEGLSEENNIRVLPTFFFYMNGKLVEKIEGANENKFKEQLEKYCKIRLPVEKKD